MPESKQPQRGRIFISYRRADSAGYAGRIYDRLVANFGEDAIFMDVDTIEGGVDFVKVLEDAVQSCDVLIALIGRQWLSIRDTSGKRRLDNPEDFVRIEVATALERNIRVIPVLVDGVEMPRSTDLPENLKALARRNALQVNHHSFNPDVYRLIEHTESALDEAEVSRVMKAQALQATREEADKEKTEREVADKVAREKTAREVQRELDRRIKKAQSDLRWKKFKNNIQQRLQMIWIYRMPILILIGALVIIIPLSADLFNKTSELTPIRSNIPTATSTFSMPLIPVTTQTRPVLPTNTYTPADSPTVNPTSASLPKVGWLVSFSREGTLTLLDMNTQQSENLLDIPDCNEEPLWYPEEKKFIICSRLFEFDMGKVNELPASLPRGIKDRINLLDDVIYSTEPLSWYNGVSSIISIDITTNTREWIADFEVTDATHEQVTKSEFTDTYTKQVLDLISVSPSNEYLLFTRTPYIVQERFSNINGVIPENPYAVLEIRPTRFFSINLSSKEIRELNCDKFYYWNAQSEIVTCENGSYIIDTASWTNTPYSVLDEYVIDFSSWSPNFLYMGFISDGNIYVYDIEKDTVSQLTESDDIIDFTWSSFGNYLLAINGDINLFDTSTGQVMYSFETPGEEASAIWMP